jgi:hypothetical protein
MNIYPQIIYADNGTTNDGTNTFVQAGIYIGIFNAATGQPANGNGIRVTYQLINSGVPGAIHTVTIIGSSVKIFNGTISTILDVNGQPVQGLTVNILSYDHVTPDAPPPNTTVCDAAINAVNIIKKESAPGAADAQVNVLAQSTQLPLSYSIDGTHFQSSSFFSGLHRGGYTAYVSDAAGCTATLGFNVPTIQNLLISDPSADLGDGNISRWNAAFNPVVFTYQRKDYEVTSITADGNGNMVVSPNADLASVLPGDVVYLNAGIYRGNYKVDKTTYGNIYIDSPFIENATGFININRLRPYYQIQTEISYFDAISNTIKSICSVNRPDSTGLVKADISSFLQSILSVLDESDFAQINYRDDHLSAYYTIRYAETWDGHAPEFVSIGNPYYVVYAARQLGNTYGGNLAAYVPFPLVSNAAQRAQWVTDFTEPAYSNGYPFDIGFIYSEALAGRDIYCEFTLLDINREPVTGSTQTSYLLNEDGSFLLNQDSTKLIIADASVSSQPIAQHVGLNRLLIDQDFPADAYYVTIVLKYDEDDTTHTITQSQTIRIDGMVDDQSVYLRWIGLTGCWNYYRFVYNQEVSLDVQNATIIKNYVSDWASQNSIEEVISKTAGQKMKVMAEDLSVADIKGLQSIKYSPKVQMLMGKNPVKWQTVVINTATFSEYETRNGQAPFSITFNLPGINIQTQ